MTTPATPAEDAHKFGAYADKIGHWTDGPETFVVTRAKNVRLGAQTYGPPQATARESALVAERDQSDVLRQDAMTLAANANAMLLDAIAERDALRTALMAARDSLWSAGFEVAARKAGAALAAPAVEGE